MVSTFDIEYNLLILLLCANLNTRHLEQNIFTLWYWIIKKKKDFGCTSSNNNQSFQQ